MIQLGPNASWLILGLTTAPLQLLEILLSIVYAQMYIRGHYTILLTLGLVRLFTLQLMLIYTVLLLT